MTEQLSAMALRLAKAKRPCPNHMKPLSMGNIYSGGLGRSTSDCTCNSTGEVYVLPDSVRVECDKQPFRTNPQGTPHQSKGKDCSRCDGRGWIPLDYCYGWEWMAALERGNLIDLSSHPSKGWECEIQTRKPSLAQVYDDTPELAFFTAAIRALKLDTEEATC